MHKSVSGFPIKQIDAAFLTGRAVFSCSNEPQMWDCVPCEALWVCSKTVMQRAFNPSDAGSTPVIPTEML